MNGFRAVGARSSIGIVPIGTIVVEMVAPGVMVVPPCFGRNGKAKDDGQGEGERFHWVPY